jgi:hypothetical protein
MNAPVRPRRLHLAVAAAALLVAGCPKHAAPTTDADAGSTAAPTASEVHLAPLVETASGSAAPAAPSALPPLVEPVATGGATKPVATAHATATTSATAKKPATPSAQAQLKSCCAALRKQAKQNAAQAAQLEQAAGVCDGLVAAVAGAGSSASMPELGPVKAMLAGLSLPPVCQGL